MIQHLVEEGAATTTCCGEQKRKPDPSAIRRWFVPTAFRRL